MENGPAPPGFRITQVHRDNPAQTRGGGLAVIHRATIYVQPRKNKLTHLSFELQLVNSGLVNGEYEFVYSGSIVVTTLDCGPGGAWFESRVGANILWGSIDCTGLTRAFILLG